MNRDEGSYPLSHVWGKLLHSDDRAPEVSPDEGFRRKAETSMNSMLLLVVLE